MLALALAVAAGADQANPAGPTEGLQGAAALRDWVQPAYPEAARREKLAGQVLVDFVVSEQGVVTEAAVRESTAGMFEEPALDAVRRWTFSPALDEGRPVAMGMTVKIEFAPAQLKQKRAPIAPERNDLFPVPGRKVPPRPVRAPDPDYPEELEEKRLPGQVDLELAVDAGGRVASAQVRWASHPAFVETALRAAEATEFEPGRQGLLKRPATMRYPVEFRSFGAKRADILAANGLRLAEGEEVPDVLPEPFALAPVVYPQAALLAGRGGEAEVEFRLGEDGSPSELKLIAASEPEFGAALLAAVDGWALQPARRGAEQARVPVRLRVRHVFAPPTGGNEARLAALVAADPAAVSGARGLDGGLKPLWRGFPVYPSALRAEAATGEAVVEFIVDRGGRVRLPRIVSATRPEFGWAAATAVQQWVFERPRRDGQAVDVRVSVPVNFAP